MKSQPQKDEQSEQIKLQQDQANQRISKKYRDQSRKSKADIIELQMQYDDDDQQLKTKMTDFIKKHDVDKFQEIRILKKQLFNKFLTQESINNRIRQIQTKIFYYPSQNLANAIENILFQPVSLIIFKTIAFKYGDLFSPSFKAHIDQVQYMTTHVKLWGQIMFDLNKLERQATVKQGNGQKKVYMLNDYNLIVHIEPQVVKVFHNNKLVNSSTFRINHLRQIAFQIQKAKCAKLLYEYLKKTDQKKKQ